MVAGFILQGKGQIEEFCPDQKLITSPKTFASQTISTLFNLMAPRHSSQ
jgi:hypothetical protein